jgi:hypothetical protein
VSRISAVSPARQLMTLIGIVVLLGGGIFILSTRVGHAAESCQGLDTALQNNLNFIAGQKANPDAQSDARIANRQAVVDLIQQRRKAAGCTANVVADASKQAGKKGSGENCAGLDKALQNNLNFIAGQKANPDAQSDARIANRQAVVDQIQQRRKAAGCDDKGDKGGNPNNGNAGNDKPNGNAGDKQNNGNGGNAGNNNAGDGGNAGNTGGAKGDVVCPGSTVTLSGEGGAPAASSSQFPAGTKLKVTNLDNNKSTTVSVTSVSGSCVLLNNAAFEQVREPGKFLIRRAVIERVG